MSLYARQQPLMHRSSRIVTQPASEPITAEQLRAHLNIFSTSELSDSEANSLISEARQYIEDYANMAIMPQTWRAVFDRWPGSTAEWWDGVRDGAISQLHGSRTNADVMELPRFPLASVTSVTVFDLSRAASSVDVASTFDVDTYSFPGRIALRYDATWPVALAEINAVEIIYVAGYATISDIPAGLLRAIKVLAAKMFSARGDDCAVEDAFAMSGAKALMAQHKVVRI